MGSDFGNGEIGSQWSNSFIHLDNLIDQASEQPLSWANLTRQEPGWMLNWPEMINMSLTRWFVMLMCWLPLHARAWWSICQTKWWIVKGLLLSLRHTHTHEELAHIRQTRPKSVITRTQQKSICFFKKCIILCNLL